MANWETRNITAAIFFIGLILSFAIGGFNLPIFFITLGLCSIVGAWCRGNPGRTYGGIVGGIWMFMLAFFFATHFWQWFLVGVVLIAISGSFLRPNAARAKRQQQVSYYQPTQQSYYQPSQSPNSQTYEQGYQPQKQAETYEEGGKNYPYSPSETQSYEQPQAEYPQQMPPPQQP